MLVKRSIVEKWYQTDSWVYKNFSYLFQNPLWQKKIPRGFSVCPYFWLSMFSLLLFRPFFVAPIKYVVTPLVKAIGKPALMVDDFCKWFLIKIWYSEREADNLPKGCNTLMFCLFILMAAAVIIGLTTLGAKLVALYAYVKVTSLGVYAYWSCASFLALFGVLATHKKLTKTNCATMNYLWVWLVLFIISSIIFIPTELVTGFGVIWASIVHVISVLGLSLLHLSIWIWGGIKLFGGFLASIAFWKPIGILMIPWWGFIVILTIFGWLADKFFSNWQDKQWDNLRQENEQELFARFRKAWIDLFVRTLIQNKFWMKGEFVEESYKFGFYEGKAVKTLRYDLYRKAFESMWKDKLDELQKAYPSLDDGVWKAMAKLNDSNSRFNAMDRGLNFIRSDFEFHILKAARTEFKDKIDKMIAEYEKEKRIEEERKASKLKSWSHLTCLKVTRGIGNGAKSVGRGIRKIWYGIRFCAVEGWTLVVYLWTLLKAKKQGVCPYFVFTEPVKQTVVVNNKS